MPLCCIEIGSLVGDNGSQNGVNPHKMTKLIYRLGVARPFLML
jgi:hypothetical protein